MVLEVPLEAPGRRIEREDRIGVEVVALALGAVVVGARVAGRPVERLQRRVERSGEPRGGAAALDGRAAPPRLGARFPARGDRPESPRFLAGHAIEGGHEAADTFVAARDPRHDQRADDQRGGRGPVVLPPVGHGRFPQQVAGEAVEREQVRVVGDHEDAIAVHRHAAVDAGGGVAGQALRARPLIVPDAAPGPGVQGVALVGAGHVHDAVDDDRRHLQARRARQREDPRRRQPRDGAAIDLVGRAVAIAARVAVIGRPIGLRRDPAPGFATPAEQMEVAGVGEQLYVGRGAVEDDAVHGGAVRHRGAQPRRRLVPSRPQRPRESQERPQVGVGDRLSRHAPGGQAVAHEGGQLVVRPQAETRHDARPHLAAAGVRTVAAAAQPLELHLARWRGLRQRRRDGRQDRDRGQGPDPRGHTSLTARRPTTRLSGVPVA